MWPLACISDVINKACSANVLHTSRAIAFLLLTSTGKRSEPIGLRSDEFKVETKKYWYISHLACKNIYKLFMETFYSEFSPLRASLKPGWLDWFLQNVIRLWNTSYFIRHALLHTTYICAPPRLSEVSPTSPLEQFQCSSDWRCSSLVLSRLKIA